MDGCIFCAIANGSIPAGVVYEDEFAVAFKDIHPVTPFHVLVVPRAHVASLNEAVATDAELLGRLLLAAAKVASDAGFGASGYRTVVNTGPDAGQTVHHVHVHVLGGKTLSWP